VCVYCNIGDHAFRHSPPWDEFQQPVPNPYIPAPAKPVDVVPWPIDRLKEYLEILKEVKRMEDQIGCPCEPNKANYIELFEKRIAALEEKKE
jgi:hypothetical protein